MKAFLSYQTSDKVVAGKLKILLARLGVSTFLAHEDIEVSEEWRLKILAELGDAKLFVALLSKNYYGSMWCIQESGIAAFSKITILPVSLDGSIPQGFFGHVQSTKIDPESPQLEALIPGVFKCDNHFAIDALIKLLATSGNYRRAESDFGLLEPYLKSATDAQLTDLLRVSTENNQVSNAGGCIAPLRTLLASHGKFLDSKTRQELTETLARYP